ncbi:MAG: FAD-binding oxidoreductase [Tannerella sp.]|jgi:D-lactate dehydrogenase|nr:FAD-binding oxidoreductase [Tannerella sp.]
MKDPYKQFVRNIRSFLPPGRALCEEQARLAWGTDAGFYRLIPKVVVFPETEEQVSRILKLAGKSDIPVTFRASGTSLSGQAVSDSVLIVAGHLWKKYAFSGDGAKTVSLQPGLVGERVNQLLKPYGRKISPDPASLKSAGIGGIVMNNASGMSCGTHANADKTIVSARIILADGTLLDTGDCDSRASFKARKTGFLQRIEELRDTVRKNKALAERIKHKYSIKNVMGLNMLPFVAYDDPFDIITHLMVGSEGTLGFLSEVTLKTEPLCPFKASAMIYFPDLKEACRAVKELKRLFDTGGSRLVASAELLDAKALACVHDTTGEGLTAILLETQAQTEQQLNEFIGRIRQTLVSYHTFSPVAFTSDERECARLWEIRSGVFPAVGGNRPSGTTALIEDVAFHDEDMPDAIAELQALLAIHGYHDACIYGHALEGNVHFILNQSFNSDAEVERYEKLMRDVVALVVEKYDGSLKAEHGTGRNMAPFVKTEWGEDAFEIMRCVKSLFDPGNLLNPGVIFNDDPLCHVRHLKPLPLTHPVVDKCIECGFCEVNCLTCGFTLSSRQRIVVQREISRLTQTGENPAYRRKLLKQYRYPGEETCAGDGLCSLSCPMGINVGELTHILRSNRHPKGSSGYRVGEYTARHLSFVKKILRGVLRIADAMHHILGVRIMSVLTRGLHRIAKTPLWMPAMPKAVSQPDEYLLRRIRSSSSQLPEANLQTADPDSEFRLQVSRPDDRPVVVYFPSCLNQTMGLHRHSAERSPLVEKTVALLNKAGYRVVFPEGMENLCCGTVWESKGMEELADRKAAELEAALRNASCEGAYPVLCDQSPCLYRMRNRMKKLKLYEPVEFIYTFLRDRLDFHPVAEPVSIHVTCSMRKMGLAEMFCKLAGLCAGQVIVPEEVGCCGFAGDKGFTHPEVNVYALRNLRPQIEKARVQSGYCNSRTCEIGLTAHSGVDYRSVVYLVDTCTTSKYSL